jgi:hypothetical protein
MRRQASTHGQPAKHQRVVTEGDLAAMEEDVASIAIGAPQDAARDKELKTAFAKVEELHKAIGASDLQRGTALLREIKARRRARGAPHDTNLARPPADPAHALQACAALRRGCVHRASAALHRACVARVRSGRAAPEARRCAGAFYEQAALFSIRAKSAAEFERYVAQVKVYYQDYGCAQLPHSYPPRR